MAATDFTLARNTYQSGNDDAAYNATGSDIPAGTTVKIDTANPMSGSQGAPGVVTATLNAVPYGITVETLKSKAYGRVQRGGRANTFASGAVTVGDVVQCDASGQVKTQSAGEPQLGIALTNTANAADPIQVAIAIAKNA